MKDIEELLRSQKVATPSDEFDTRMNGLFEKPPVRRSIFLRRNVALWQAAAVSLLMGGLGYGLGHAPGQQLSEEPQFKGVTTMYIIETHTDGVGNTFETVPAVEPFYKPPSPPISVVWTILRDDPAEDRTI